MQQMTFMECVNRAWASAGEAVRRMPAVVLGVFVVYAALGGLSLAVHPVEEGLTLTPEFLFMAYAASFINALVYVWFALKVYRFVLLGEHTSPIMPNGARPMLRMLGLGLLMMLVLVGASMVLGLALRPQTFRSAVFLSLICMAIWLFVGVRVSLLYPSLAIGGRFALADAWRDSSGHFWNLLGVSFVAALPLIACALVLLLGVGITDVSPAIMQTPPWAFALIIVQSAGYVAFALLTSSALAWLYRRYANALGASATPSAR